MKTSSIHVIMVLISIYIKKVMVSLYPEIESTADLDTKQLQWVYENLNNFTASHFEIGLDWPDRFNAGICDSQAHT